IKNTPPFPVPPYTTFDHSSPRDSVRELGGHKKVLERSQLFGRYLHDGSAQTKHWFLAGLLKVDLSFLHTGQVWEP
ncbi:MAG: hypothetical protein ACREJU_01930, partial [Nitrospiraceae bacterium]